MSVFVSHLSGQTHVWRRRRIFHVYFVSCLSALCSECLGSCRNTDVHHINKKNHESLYRSLHHSIITSLHHYITPSLHHSITTDTPTDSHKASFTVRTHLKIKLWTDSYSTWSSVFPAIEQCFRSIIKNKQFNVNNVNMHRSSPSAGDHVSSEVWAVGFTLSHSHCWLDCLSAKWTHSYITWSPQWRSQAQCFINHSESERWRHSHTCASVQLFGRWVQTKQNTFISGLEPNTEV